MALLTLLRRMDRTDVTAHGSRATFRTWATQTTNSFEHALVEKALAHTLGKLDLAYQRGAMIAKRRELMAAWGQYLADDQHRTRAAG